MEQQQARPLQSFSSGDGQSRSRRSPVKSSPSPTSTTSSRSSRSFDVEDESCDNVPTTANQKYDYLYYIIMIGDSGVGKTDLIGRLGDDHFQTKFCATIGINMESHILEDDDGSRFKLQIWDPSGSERFRDVITKCFRNAQGMMFVFDVNYLESFENVKTWIESVSQHPEVASTVAKILVGNKCDTNRRVVDSSNGEALAAQYEMKYVETSARTGQNVNHAFRILCQQIKFHQENPSSMPSSTKQEKSPVPWNAKPPPKRET